MEILVVFIGLASTILGGAIVVFFQMWLEHRKEISAERKQVAQQRTFRSNLPNRDYIEFVGRQHALKTGVRVLSSGHRIGVVTIDGIGGVGKTTLALEIAHRCCAKEMFDAVIWVSAKQTALTPQGIIHRHRTFSNFDDLCLVAAHVLQNVEILSAPPAERPLLLQRACSKERILLILDNLETIDDEQIIDFLRELPVPSKAIVTTRHRINVSYDIRLTSMSLEESTVLMHRECEKRSLRIGDEDLKKLYYRTGGIPLAMVWSISQIAGKGRTLNAILDSLGQPYDDVCQFCFKESFKLLDYDERRTLLALSLFEEPAGREVIGVVAGLGKNILVRDEALAKLVQLSLVAQHGNLFDMLPLARNYARNILEQSPILEQETKERWVRHYIARESSLVPITIYFPIYIPGELERRIRAMVNKFNGLGFGVHAIPIFTGTYMQTNETLRQALAKGPVPDIAVLELALWLEMVEKGSILPLDGTVLPEGREYFLEQGFDQSACLNITYRGKVYGIPFVRSVPMVYYNCEMFERAGIDGLKHPPLTWNTLIEYAQCIQKATRPLGLDSFFPIGLPIEDWFIASFSRQAGGRMLDDEGRLPTFINYETLEALDFWTKLCKLKLARPNESWFQTPQDFVRGQCAIAYHTSGSLSFFTTASNFSVGTWMPPYQVNPGVETGGANFVILANRPFEQQKAAWQFINWFTQPEQSAEWAIATGYLPVRSQSFQLPSYVQYMNLHPEGEAAITLRNKAYARASAPYFVKLRPVLLEAITDTLTGNKTSKESLQIVQDNAIQLSRIQDEEG